MFALLADNREAIFAELKRATADEKEIMSSALSQLQVDFVKGRNQQLKCLIQLVKFWAQKGFAEKEDQQLPSPYLIELIAIYCWEHASSPETFKFANAFHAILQTMRDHKSLKAIWTKYYSWDTAQETAHLERFATFLLLCIIFIV